MSIFSTFDIDNDIVPANPTVVTTGLWSNETGSLESTLYVSTTQLANSKEYYIDAYSTATTNELAEVQFAVTYGHIDGGGAPTLDINEQATLPTKAIYSQYRNLLLDPTDTKFSFQGVESNHIYVINFQRARIREQLDPGNWELPLSGALGIRTFIDDSAQTLGALTANSKAGRVFSVVSGSISSTTGIVTSSTNAKTWGVGGPGYGLVYPDLGIIVLNPDAIGPSVGFFTSASNTSSFIGSAALTSSLSASTFYNGTSGFDTTLTAVTSNPYAPVTHSLTSGQWGTALSTYNHAALFIAINKAITSPTSDRGFQARSAETISSTHYFVRLRNRQFNYSNNPTFYNADNGSLVFSDFRKNPKVYVTTVGLYNSTNELLAVAKLSKPVRKSFDEEVLLRVRLDY
jgi:hypothetical protein